MDVAYEGHDKRSADPAAVEMLRIATGRDMQPFGSAMKNSSPSAATASWEPAAGSAPWGPAGSTPLAMVRPMASAGLPPILSWLVTWRV